MNILAIDTATEACSAALWQDGRLLSRYAVAPRGHTEMILPMVDELLAEAGLRLQQLDGLACDRGPGSFTGIRVGLSVVQGLALAADLPVTPVSSLAALAQAAWQQYRVERVLSMIDARMQEIYWAYYQCDNGSLRLQGEECLSAFDAIPLHADAPLAVTGSALAVYRAPLAAQPGLLLVEDSALRYPRAEDVARLAAAHPHWALPVEQVEPVYLRNQVTG